MDKFADNNDFEICPYNNAHRLERGTRFQSHLEKCRLNYPDVQLVACPFNNIHRIREPELKFHMQHCRDGDDVRKNMTKIKNQRKFVPPVQPVTMQTSNVSNKPEENWDDELLSEPKKIPTLNDNVPFLNSDRLSGLKPAEKKKIRKNLTYGRRMFEGTSEDIKVEPENGFYDNPSPQPPKTTINCAETSGPSVVRLKDVPLPQELPESVKPFRNGIPNTRIAAGIFNTKPSVPNPFAMVGIGRGVPVKHPPACPPPPGFGLSQQ